MTEVPTVGDTVATRVRRYRQAQGLSVRALAERCAALGMPTLTIGSLSNIERGQDPAAKRGRREVTVDELMVLSLALEVPPLLLLVPYGETDAVRVAPGRQVHPTAAAEWIAPTWYQRPIRELFDADPVVDPNTASYAIASRSLRLLHDLAHVLEVAQQWRDMREQAILRYGEVSAKLYELEQEQNELLAQRKMLHRKVPERSWGMEGEPSEAEDLLITIEKGEEARITLATLSSRLSEIEERGRYTTRSYVLALDGLARVLTEMNELGLQVPPIPTAIADELEKRRSGRFFNALTEERPSDAS